MPPPKSAAADERVLSYNDEILHRSDLEILRSPSAFINDRLISFFFTHLSISLSLPSSILLLPPSISFLLSVAPDPSVLHPIDLLSKTLILLPVNDNSDPDLAEGGAHWSLLVYERSSNEFIHHDSCRGLNAGCARRLFMGLKGILGGDGDKARFVQGPTPQQGNGYDCGLFVMAIARVICEWKAKGREGSWFAAVEEEVNAMRVAKLREEVLELVLSLIEEWRRKDAW